ncbi:putative acetyltransferase [compost metagenome]
MSQIGTGVKIGNGSGINAYAYLGGQGGIAIGENVIIGPGVKIFSENHVFADLDESIKSQGVSRKGVVIKDDCWIGSNVTILDGVVIESGCVIAAGAVVTKSIPKMSVAGGVPAKVLKNRAEMAAQQLSKSPL